MVADKVTWHLFPRTVQADNTALPQHALQLPLAPAHPIDKGTRIIVTVLTAPVSYTQLRAVRQPTVTSLQTSTSPAHRLQQIQTVITERQPPPLVFQQVPVRIIAVTHRRLRSAAVNIPPRHRTDVLRQALQSVTAVTI